MGACCGPPHLVQLVHAPIDQGVGEALRTRRADRLTASVAGGVVHEMVALPAHVVATLVKCAFPVELEQRLRPATDAYKRTGPMSARVTRTPAQAETAVKTMPHAMSTTTIDQCQSRSVAKFVSSYVP